MKLELSLFGISGELETVSQSSVMRELRGIRGLGIFTFILVLLFDH